MNKILPKIAIVIYILTVVGEVIGLAYYGRTFYNSPIEERFFNSQYELLKPSGYIGHGLGIAGATLIIGGILLYSLRKRVKAFSRIGKLKHWLEFHIFLCTLGTVFVLFHTTFKFGGIISVGFWSLAIVWVSGVVGRFIYVQIPRTIEGREMTLNEISEALKNISDELTGKYGINFSEIKTSRFSQIRLKLVENHISSKEFGHIKSIIRKQRIIEARIKRLEKMQKMFHYWHIAHVPFAVIMILILIIHVGVVLFFGYKWIF